MNCDNELRQLANDLNVKERLFAIGATAHYMQSQQPNAYYYLIDLDITRRRLSISKYTKRQTTEATTKLAELEMQYREEPSKDVLLVSVSSVDELRKMYPNYHADTKIFTRELERMTRQQY